MTDLEYVELAAKRARERAKREYPAPYESAVTAALRILADEFSVAVVERNALRDGPEA